MHEERFHYLTSVFIVVGIGPEAVTVPHPRRTRSRAISRQSQARARYIIAALP